MKKYSIGQGTCIVNNFETKEELDDYFDKMEVIDRHFCRVYNIDKKTSVLGCEYQYNHQI